MNLLLLLLGMLAGANAVFAAIWLPGLVRLLSIPSMQQFVVQHLALFYLAYAGISGAALAFSYLAPCAGWMLKLLLSLCCVAALMAWSYLRRPGLLGAQLQLPISAWRQGLLALNTGQWAVVSVLFFQVAQRCAIS